MPVMQHQGEPQLPLLVEKNLPYSIRSGLVAYDSRTDLLAVVTEEENIEVYRLGGQRAFTVKRRTDRYGEELVVEQLRWIRGGRFLAIAWNGRPVEIVSGENGKFVRHADNTEAAAVDEEDAPRVTCLGWGVNSTHTGDVYEGKTIANAGSTFMETSNPTTEEWYDRAGTSSLTNNPLEDALANDTYGLSDTVRSLPRQLALLDVERALPKLSPIPRGDNARRGEQNDTFSTQAALDTYFYSLYNRGSSVIDVMAVGHDDGSFYVILDQIFRMKGGKTNLDPLQLPQMPERPPSYLMHASHPQSPHHALLRGFQEDDISQTERSTPPLYSNLFLEHYTIPNTNSDGSHLDLIMSKTALTRDLGNYAAHTANSLQRDWKTHRDLPSRFMRGINMELEEKSEGTLEQNLYQLAMTGSYTPTMLEWVKDTLAERGHRRWDAATTSLYTSIGGILQTNFLPVLERLAIVATDLRGLAKFYEGSRRFNVSADLFTRIIEAVATLRLLVEEAVRIVGEEHRQYRAFSRWLRHAIDIAAAEPGSTSAEEMAEREVMGLDYDRLLAYIEGALTKSKLEAMVSDFAGKEPAGREGVVEAIGKARNGALKDEEKGKLSLLVAMRGLKKACKEAEDEITKWQSSILTSARVVPLNPSTMDRDRINPQTDDDFVSAVFDMRIIYQNGNPEVWVLALPKEYPDQVNFYIVNLHEAVGQSPVTSFGSVRAPYVCIQAYGFHNIDTQIEGEVRDVKFLDDTSYVALLVPEEGPSTLVHCRLPDLENQHDLDAIGSVEDEEKLHVHVFPEDGGFVPNRLLVNGRKGRQSVVVLEKENRGWKILDLGAGSSGRGDDAADEDGNSMTAD